MSEIQWHDCASDPPDDDTTVLLYAPGYEVWPGWKDGETGTWLWYDGNGSHYQAIPKLWCRIPHPEDK